MTTPHTADVKKAGRGWRIFLIATALVSLYLNLVYALTPKLNGHFPATTQDLRAAEALVSLTPVDVITGVLIAVVPVGIAVWLAEAVKDPLVQSWVKATVIVLMVTCMIMSIAHQAEVLTPKVGDFWAYVMPLVLDTSAMVALGLFMKAKREAYEAAQRLLAVAERVAAKDSLRQELEAELRAEAAASAEALRGDITAKLTPVIRGDILAATVAVIGGDIEAAEGVTSGGDMRGVIDAVDRRVRGDIRGVIAAVERGDIPPGFEGDIARLEEVVRDRVTPRLEDDFEARLEAARGELQRQFDEAVKAVERQAEARALLSVVADGKSSGRRAIGSGKARQTGKAKPVRQAATSDDRLERLRALLEESRKADRKMTNQMLAEALECDTRTVMRLKKKLEEDSDGQIVDAEVVDDDSGDNVRTLRAG